MGSEKNIQHYMIRVGTQAREASRLTTRADGDTRNAALLALAGSLRRESGALLAANREDLAAARADGLAPAMLDRLALNGKSVAAMAAGVEQVAALPDPVGEITELKFRPSGIQVGIVPEAVCDESRTHGSWGEGMVTFSSCSTHSSGRQQWLRSTK